MTATKKAIRVKILGIDPGPQKSACVLWDSEKGILKHWVEINPLVELTCKGIADEHWGDFPMPEIAIEMIQSFGMPVGKEVFQTVYQIGRFAALGQTYSNLVYRGQIKMNICKTMKAKDGNIRQALIDRFGAPGIKKNPGYTYGLKADEWQAFAVAVTYFDLRPQLLDERNNLNKP